MKNKLTAVIRILAFSALGLLPLPLLYASTAIGLNDSGKYQTLAVVFRRAQILPALGCLPFMVLACWLGAGTFSLRAWLHGRITEEKNFLRFLANLASLLLPAAVIGTAAALTFRLELYWLFGLIGGIFCTVLGYRNFQKPYGEFFTRYLLMVSVGVAAAAMLLLYAVKMDYDPSLFIWNFFIQAVLCALSQNQGNIDYLMERRRHDLSHLPQKVRWYSLFLTGGILLLALAVVLLRPQLARLFGAVLEAARQLIRWVLLAIIWFTGLFSSEEAAPIEEEAASTGGGGLPYAGGTASPWWDYILLPLLAVVIAFLLWTYRRDIFRFLRQLGRQIRDFFSRQLLRSPALQRLARADTSEYYTDQVDTLSPETWREGRPEGFRYREWKRRVKKFTALSPSPQKYRLGYRLGLEWLSWKGVDIHSADTPHEILQKAQGSFTPSQWEAVTGFYQLVRYREDPQADAAALSQLTESLKQMAK